MLDFAHWLIAIGILIELLFGLVYVTRRKLMPYHLELIGASWDSMGDAYRLLFKNLVKLVGATLLTLGGGQLAFLCYLEPTLPALVVMALINSTFFTFVVSLMVEIRRSSAAKPPLPIVLFALVSTLVGLLLISLELSGSI